MNAHVETLRKMRDQQTVSERDAVSAYNAAIAALEAQGNENTEEWRAVVGFENLYEVSSLGRLKSLRSGKTLSGNAKAGKGYTKADLHREGERTQTYIHRLVCEAFNGPCNGREVNHKDGNKGNNAATNLEWVTASENIIHSYYELGNLIRPVVATPVDGGIPVYFRSIEEAVSRGFRSGHIYRCLKNPNLTHAGFYWARPESESAPPSSPAMRAVVEFVQDIANGNCCRTEGCSTNYPQCEAMQARAVLAHPEVKKLMEEGK